MRTLLFAALAAVGLGLAVPSTASAQYYYNPNTGQYYSYYAPYGSTTTQYYYYPNTGYTFSYNPGMTTSYYSVPAYTYTPGYYAGSYSYPYTYSYRNFTAYPRWGYGWRY